MRIFDQELETEIQKRIIVSASGGPNAFLDGAAEYVQAYYLMHIAMYLYGIEQAIGDDSLSQPLD